MLNLARKIGVRPPAIVINIRDLDPSQTLTLRRQFLADVNRRFRQLRAAIWKKIVDEDFLNSDPLLIVQRERVKYEYEYADRKIAGFMEWLEKMQKIKVGPDHLPLLELVQGPGAQISQLGQEVPWTNTYIQSAYQRGIAHTRADLRRGGAAIPEMGFVPANEIQAVFNTPFHSGRVGLVYSRAFNGMKGITAQMNTQLSHVLATGMAEGRGIREIARMMDPKINTFKNRARLIARTEVVHAHNNATLNEFERIEGQTEEVILTQWLTARDERVRVGAEGDVEGIAGHAAWHRKVYTRIQAGDMIGAPNCRCALLPYMPGIYGVPELASDEAMKVCVREAKKAGLLKGEDKTGSFKPSKTLSEAAKWAENNIADKVNFRGVPVGVANEINETLNDLIVKNNKIKLEALVVEKDVGSTISMNAVGHAPGNNIFLNYNYIKNNDEIRKIQISNKIKSKKLREKITEREKYLFDQGYTTEDIKEDKRMKRYIKAENDIVNEKEFFFMGKEQYSIRDTVTHEYGHVVDANTVKKLVQDIDPFDFQAQGEAIKDWYKLRDKAFRNASKRGAKISGYASTTKDEFIAEAWAIYHNGGKDLLSSEIIKAIEYMKRTSL